MEVIERVIDYHKGDVFSIYPLGDMHFGSIHAAESSIQKKVLEIAGQKHSLVIGMGDYTDSILKNDPRFDIEGLAPWVIRGNIVESQRRKVRELFEPLKGQLLGLLTGNHEEEIHIHYQDDITRNLCNDLKVPYLGYTCFLVLNFRCRRSKLTQSGVTLYEETNQIIIHAWHGAGSAQTEGARLMRLMRLVNEVQAHIYLMGHLHAMTQHTPDRLIFSRGKIKSVKLAATITGSWLTTYTQPKSGQELGPSYGEKKGYLPSRIGCPVIHIHPDTEEFTIES